MSQEMREAQDRHEAQSRINGELAEQTEQLDRIERAVKDIGEVIMETFKPKAKFIRNGREGEKLDCIISVEIDGKAMLVWVDERFSNMLKAREDRHEKIAEVLELIRQSLNRSIGLVEQ
jgi:hypothetical protein